MTIRRTLVAALAITAIAAPAATAQPADMHVLTAQAGTPREHRPDMGVQDTFNAAQHPRKTVNAPGATAADSQSITTAVPPGQPTWAVDPEPIPPETAVAASQSDDGIDWATIGLGIAGTLLALSGIAALTSHSRRLPRPRPSS